MEDEETDTRYFGLRLTVEKLSFCVHSVDSYRLLKFQDNCVCIWPQGPMMQSRNIAWK